MKILIHMTSLVCIATLAAAPAAYAFQDQGNKEVEFSGGFSHASGSSVGTVNVDASYAYYVYTRINFGVRQTLNYNFIDNAKDTWTASTIPFVNYNFMTSNPSFRPFIGAFMGAAYNRNDTTGTTGPMLGFKYFLNNNTAVVARYRYEWYFDKLSFKDVRDTANGNNIVTVGLNFIF
jgi:hypothetical protein